MHTLVPKPCVKHGAVRPVAYARTNVVCCDMATCEGHVSPQRSGSHASQSAHLAGPEHRTGAMAGGTEPGR